MNQRKENQKEAQSLALDLKQKEEIDQKLDYYKSILKSYEDLQQSIDKKIESLESDSYEAAKLRIEKIETVNTIFEKKKFFEMWLKRSTEYDRKFALITEDYNKHFDSLLFQARQIASNNLRISQILERYDKEDKENLDQKALNELYLLLKYEVGRSTGKLKFAVES